jgi:hypothetical protein
MQAVEVPNSAEGAALNKGELFEAIWDELPFFRRHLLGREKIEDLFLISIEQSPESLFQHVTASPNSQEVVLTAWGQSVKRGYCLLYGEDVTFGPLFWILISPVLQYMLKRILEWWFESRSHRVLFAGWKQEATR